MLSKNLMCWVETGNVEGNNRNSKDYKIKKNYYTSCNKRQKNICKTSIYREKYNHPFSFYYNMLSAIHYLRHSHII